MKKYLMTAALAAALVPSVSAQGTSGQEVTETEVLTSFKTDYRSNWFVSAGAGGQVFMGDHDRQAKLKDRISPALDIAVGRWVSPSIGVRLMYSGLSGKGVTQTWGKPDGGVYSTGKEVPGKYTNPYGYLTQQKFNMMTLHVDVLLDVTNMIGGYNPKRVYGCAPYVGVGWGHVFENMTQNTVIGNIGVFNMFHVNKAIDINLDLRAMVSNDQLDGETGRRDFDGMLSVSAGVTYRFAPRGWKTRMMKVTEKVVEVKYDNEKVNDLRRQVQILVAENEKLEKEAAGKVVEHKAVKVYSGNYLIYFPINVSELSNADRAQLHNVASMIKQTGDNTVFTVIGYADKATGNARINETLSRERAMSVRNYLVNELGVPADRLEVSWNGDADNLFYNDPELNRVVIVSAKK